MSNDKTVMKPDDVRESLADWQNRPKQQSGMEKQHEEWVLATLNFLTSLDIPFYTYKPNGDRDPRADKSIPERLKLLGDKHATLVRSEGRARTKLWQEEDRVRHLTEQLKTQKEILTKAYNALVPDTGAGASRPGEAIMLLEPLIDHPEKEENSADGNT